MIGLTYTLRVSVHNSRTFVGPSYELTNISHLDVPGWKVLQVPAPDAVFDYVMGDVLTAIVVELLATPPQVYQPDVLPAVQYSLGWSAFVPFSFISDDGAQSEVAVGVHRYPLVGESGLLLRDQPPLDWRSLLGDSTAREIPDPLVEFQLFETGRTPIPPPLNRNFTFIEKQREEEAAMGEQPLEQVLAPVQVPPEIAPPPGPIVVADAYVQEVFSAQPQVPPPHMGPLAIQEPLPPILQARNDALYGPTNDRERDQLRDLAEAMQKQLALLTRAVDELKDERKSLRSSVLALADGSRVQQGQTNQGQTDVFK
jgi:nephrocystin-4